MTDKGENDLLKESSTENALATLTLSQVEQLVDSLPAPLHEDQILQWLMLSQLLLQRAKAIRQRVEEIAIDWIKGNGQIECGTVIYSVGPQKSVRCVSAVRCMQLLLEACGGDIEMLCTYLGSNPFKHGACGTLLPEPQWKSVFKAEYKDKLVLKTLDTRFLPDARRADQGE